MWPKSSSAALLLCGSLLLSIPIFVAADDNKISNGCFPPDCTPTDVPTLGFPTTFPASSQNTVATSVARQSPTSPAATGKTGSNTSDDAEILSKPKSSGANVGAIAGGVVGGLLALALIGVGIFFFVRKRNKRVDSFELEKSPAPASAAPRISSSPAPASQMPPPHQQPISPNEEHSLMSNYGELQPQNVPPLHRGEAAPQLVTYGPGEVIPVVGPKPYAVGSSREIDEDQISIDPPSPSTTPNPERQQQRSVPRLPMYQSSRDDSNTTPGL